MNAHVKRIGEPLAGEEHGGFKKTGWCEDHIFAFKQVMENILDFEKT